MGNTPLSLDTNSTTVQLSSHTKFAQSRQIVEQEEEGIYKATLWIYPS